MKAPLATNKSSATPPPAAPTRVLCVDDNPDVTEVLRLVIDTDPRIQCVGSLASADQLAKTIRGMSPRPDVVLLDATMPGKSPLAMTSQMAAEFPAVRIIIYSGHNDADFIARAKAAGAWGYVSKNEEPDVILHAVLEVAAGNAWWP
jgi:DNA-binding NarL/FixJ family response regulator